MRPASTPFPDLPRRTRYAFRLRQQLRCGFWYRPAGTGEINTRCQGDYSIIYVLVGGGTYQDATTTTTFGPGDVIQRFPDRPREIRFSQEEMLQLSMGVPRLIYDALVLGGVPEAANPVLRIGVHRELITAGERIVEELRTQPDDRLYETLARMHRLLAEIHRLAAPVAPSPSRPEVAEACAILEEAFDRTVHLPRLAARLNLSYTTFRRLFTQQMGVSPGEYRLRRRTEYVQDLLCDPRLSMAEIADRAGYRDLFALSRQFRQRTGVSPRQFRELYG